jgi:hypothetical protein
MALSPSFFLRRSLIALPLLFLGPVADAQIDNVYVYGTVKDYNSSKKLDGVTVNVIKDGAPFTSVVTSANGKYEFNLDFGHDYKLLFEKSSMVSKNVTINTSSIPEEERQGGMGMNVEMTLFQELPGVDFKLLQQPIGKSKYDPATKNLAWDLAYTAQIQAEMSRMLKEYDERKKREANAEEEFAKAMKQGADAMAAASYDKAVSAFTAALGFKPKDPIATAKLSDAQIKLNELDQAAKKDAQYSETIKAADGLFGKKLYAEAKAKYQEASQLKDQEAYPKQKLKECDAFLDALAKQAEEEKKAKAINDQYNAAVAAADAAFKAGKYEAARTGYTEAQGLKPQEKYPPDQLAAIAAKLDELAKKAEADAKAKESEANYQAAITAGDAAFKKADYETAKGKYNDALALKPKEKYPTDQLAAIAAKLEELAKKAEAEAQAKELDARYKAAITAADAAFKSTDYGSAKGKYNEALELKPKEKYPTDQLAAIAAKLDELAKKAEADAKAKELDAQYQTTITAADNAFKGADYETAKTKYNEALGLKPKEKYPTDQLAAIAKKLDELAKQAEAEAKSKALDEQYGQLVDEAEKLFSEAAYAEAKGKFQQALQLKPAEARPKERIVEIDAKLADLAKQAEEKRKQEELDAKYGALITDADKLAKAEKTAEALNAYKNASALKPDEQYPKDRIGELEQLLDAAAREKAEQDRLAQEAKDKEARYNAAIQAADLAFKSEAFGKALDGYGEALTIKPDEQYPADQMELVRKRQAELAAKSEADSLKAAQDAAEQARIAEEEARTKQEAADVQARYDAAVAKADAAFAKAAWDQAREGFTEASSIKPDERYPKDRLAAIDAELAKRSEADRLAAEAAEKARREAEEAQRRLAEQSAADSLARVQAQQERNAQQALDERYNGVVREANEAMARTEYTEARDLFTQALDIKPDETYPQVKIGQIDALLAEQAQAEEARRKQQEAVKPPPPPPSPVAMDNRKEQEAEEFMREAREREEAEKYEKVKRFKNALQEQTTSDVEAAATRQQQDQDRTKALVEGGASLYTGSEEQRKRNAQELEALRQAWAERAKQLEAQDQEDSRRALETVDAMQRTRNEYSSGSGREGRSLEDLEAWKEAYVQRNETLAEAAQARTAKAYADVEARHQEAADMLGRGGERAQGLQESSDRFKDQEALRQQQLSHAGQARTITAMEQLGQVSTEHAQPFAQNSPNKLATEYPQGVTEESYTEGNKVIIRRVVVQGNRANAYSKVIAKWGTYYFKDGQPISEQIWTVNTGQ